MAVEFQTRSFVHMDTDHAQATMMRRDLLVVTKNEGTKKAETKAEASQGLENALLDLVRRAVGVELQEIVRLTRQQDRRLTIDEVA
jgi:hypothetical protein